MSINLHVEDYCQNCPKFEPEVFTNLLKFPDGDNIYCHDVYCTSHDRCRAIVEHLKTEQSEGKPVENKAHWLINFDEVSHTTTFKCSKCGYVRTYVGKYTTWDADKCVECGTEML